MPENNPIKTTPPITKKHWSKKSLGELLNDFQKFLHSLVDIKVGMDQSGTLINIHNNKEMRGANAWLLMCSIMVASLGLDLNSPAVIIGAMLISPLMSPILGIGLGFGINDRETLLVSLRHFGIAIIIALTTSFLYFKITPFGTLTDEISSRTAPNLLDGLVAIFGGLAGVISVTRLDKSNAIPGVAIATALMPPLCVAGFGLANGEWQFFTNAFYLFFLNSFFIAISTYIVIRVLGFRYKTYPNEKETKRNRLIMFVFAVLILIPAINLLLKAYNKLQEEAAIEQFITDRIGNKTTAVSNWKFHPNDTLSELDLQLIGQPVNKDSIKNYGLSLKELLNKPVKINTYQSREIPFDEIQRLKNLVGGFQGEIDEKVKRIEAIQEEKQSTIDQLSQEIDSLKTNIDLTNIYKETKTLFPLLEEIGLTENMQKTNFSTEIELPVLLIKWNRKKNTKTKLADEQKLRNFVQLRTKLDTLMVVTY